ncbi:MAG: hypothetical protein ACR2FH_02480, partial [Caulobacteraceae bacterium]
MAEPSETTDVEGEETPAPVSPAAVAVAMARTGRGEEALDADAGVFLREHTRMLGVQIEHLHEQRVLTTKHLEWRLFGDRVKGALQVLSLIAGAAVVVGLAALVWSAREDRGLVVEAFSVPPDRAQKGLTGQVMASLVLDKISSLDAQAQSVRAASSYKNNWGGDIKVEIPTTGISLGELDRWLKNTLGRGTIISGNVYRPGGGPTSGGLTVTVRAGESPPAVASGADADLDSLIGRAAEAVYAATQPYRYSKYLENHGRIPEALAVARRLAIGAPETAERAWAFGQVANLLGLQGDLQGGVAAAREALSLKPDLAIGAFNLAGAEQMLGHDAAALRAYRVTERLLQSPDANISRPGHPPARRRGQRPGPGRGLRRRRGCVGEARRASGLSGIAAQHARLAGLRARQGARCGGLEGPARAGPDAGRRRRLCRHFRRQQNRDSPAVLRGRGSRRLARRPGRSRRDDRRHRPPRRPGRGAAPGVSPSAPRLCARSP